MRVILAFGRAAALHHAALSAVPKHPRNKLRRVMLFGGLKGAELLGYGNQFGIELDKGIVDGAIGRMARFTTIARRYRFHRYGGLISARADIEERPSVSSKALGVLDVGFNRNHRGLILPVLIDGTLRL